MSVIHLFIHSLNHASYMFTEYLLHHLSDISCMSTLGQVLKYSLLPLSLWNLVKRQLLSKEFQAKITICANVLKQRELDDWKERRLVVLNWTHKLKPKTLQTTLTFDFCSKYSQKLWKL